MDLEDAIKAWGVSVKDATDTLKHVNERKVEAEAASEAKKAAKSREAAQKKLESQLKQASKVSEISHIWFQDLPIFANLPEIAEANFSTEIGKHSDEPYMVQVPSLCNVIESNAQSILSVFAAQFPMSPQARERGRVQSPLKVTEAQLQKIKEGVASFKRGDNVKFFEGSDKSLDLSQVHLFGFMASMVYCGPEFNSLATLRYTHKGERTVILMKFTDFWSKLGQDEVQFKLDPKYNITHYLQDLLSKATAESHVVKQLMEASVQENIMMYRGTIGPKTLLYVPAGVLVIERSLNQSSTVGLRLSVQDLEGSALANLAELLRIHEQYAPDSTLAKIWKVASGR